MTPEQLVKAVTAATGFTHAAGVQVVQAEPGNVTLRLPRKAELLQFNGFFHGGAISGLADHAAGAAATTALPAGKIAVTVDLHVNFLQAANGQAIVATARTVSVGGTICVVSAEVHNEADGQSTLCAVATATLRVVPAPPMGKPS